MIHFWTDKNAMKIKKYFVIVHLQFFQCNEFHVLQVERERRPQRRNSIHGCDKQQGCLMCVKYIPVRSPDEIEIGDHLVFKRRFYDHHGIITGKKIILGQGGGYKFQITEPTNPHLKAMAAIGTSKIVGGKAVIRCKWRFIDFDKRTVGVVVYKKRFSKNVTASLAICIYKKFKESPESYKYHLLTNNCEHFATYCATGEMFSLQVATHASTIPTIFSILELEPEVKRKCMQYMYCMPCFKTVKIQSKNDVKEGDIILYHEQKLWHYAVVLEKKKSKKASVKCFVVHNTSCAQGSCRLIEADLKEIQFNGSFYKLDFTSSKFKVYDPKVVVNRARNSMGKQMFEFFINQCSYFPIWCKLNF